MSTRDDAIERRVRLREAALKGRGGGNVSVKPAPPHGAGGTSYDMSLHPKDATGRWRANGGRRKPPAKQSQQPVFHAEGPAFYAAAFARNRQFAKPGPYQAKLSDVQEGQFRAWLKAEKIPFDANAKITDYDMRGYWLANRNAKHADGQHFPDTFKTPYDTTFSRESKYATPNCPFVWKGNDLVDRRTGQLVFR